MKYDEKYPNAEYLEQVQGGIYKGHGNHPCFICGELTEFVDMDYQAHICSEECLLTLDKKCYEDCIKSEA